MNSKERTNDLRFRLSRIVDNKLILIDSPLALNTLIGIKISLIKYKDSRVSHQNAVESIVSKPSIRFFDISELDRCRLERIILPRLEETSLSWDSSSKKVPFWDALELFETDLEYLLSKELEHYLPQHSVAARHEVLADIRRKRLHPKFGRGSKVSLEQYQQLVKVTAEGWVAHLAELSANESSEPVYELGEPCWRECATDENEAMLRENPSEREMDKYE